MKIKTSDYQVWIENSIIHFEGTMRLSGTKAYQPIMEIMDAVLASNPVEITLNLTGLEFLNSSGINLLARFTITVRKQGAARMVVKGSTGIPWQAKSLPNLKKLHPALTLSIV